MQYYTQTKRILKYFIFPFLLISLFTFRADNSVAISAAPTIITTRASDSYINDYYSSIGSSLTGSALAGALESRLKAERKASFSYGSLDDNAFPYTDVDPTRPNEGYIVSFYSGKAVKGYTGMNKEHTWPNSHGGNKIENDPHMVRPTIKAENSSRGNEYFAAPGTPGWDPAELGDYSARGMAARIVLYGAVIGKSSGLILEDVGRGQDGGTGNKMGKLGDLLKWNLEYPVNQKEIIRNETLDISLNYNRNPFIDRPEYACSIWGETNANTRSICASYTPVEVEGVSVSPTYSTINLLSEVKGVQLSANILPANASNKNVTWSSTNPSVASVSSSGYVTGISVGQATIFATSSSNSSKVGQTSIEVVSATIPVSGVSLNKATTTLEIGKTETLSATISPSGATNKGLTWTSSNPTAATVNNGVVTGLAKGTTTISVKTNDGNFTASTIVSVVTPAPVTTVTGSFYNTTSDNNGGVGGVNALNLNNGTTGSNSIVGFGGKRVINTVNPDQAYLPRGAGLAIGSSGNPGYLEITLNDDFKASKVEVLINNSTSGATSSLETDITPKSNNPGTYGSQYSNPSAGTYFTLEFNEPHNYFKIKTTKRMIVVEIRLTIGSNSVIEETPQEEAEAWSSNFLNLTNVGCSLSDRDLLLGAWNEAMYSFENLSSEAQLLIKESVAEYDTSNNIKHAKARYQVILNGYQFDDFIYNLPNISGRAQNNNLLIPGTFILSTSILVFGLGLTLLRLKNKKRNK